MTEHPILFNGEMVKAILGGRNSGSEMRRTYALPLLKETDPQHLADRIMNSITGINPNGCWIWGRTISEGYGSMTIKRRTQRAHRIAWTITRGGLIPKGMCICHKCDNPLCVNPEHLFLGTRSDNMKDMVNKGRHGGPPPPQRGAKNPAAKLTIKDVDEIRGRLIDGETQSFIATAFHISQSQISNIKRGLRW